MSLDGPARELVLAALREHWGYESLRPLQAEAIAAELAGRDSLIVMPTGGGKSLCYQIPALVAKRCDVVISPLIALMKDQVDALREIGYPAGALHSGMSRAEQVAVERELSARRLCLLFLAPERLMTGGTVDLLSRAGVSAFAIDEAHCISHWGHDFRKEYRTLARLRGLFPQASVHAYTATATRRVRADIVQQLCLRDPLTLVGCFDRPNLIYRVVPKADAFAQVAGILSRHRGQAAIVYCLSRRETEELAESLRSIGVRACAYHAGMTPEERRRTQDDFAAERISVVTATVAFGMGIDRSDVRCVIHTSAPKSIEHYQQETGRAGRDGLEAECVLLYSFADIARWQDLIARSAEQAANPAPVIEAAAQLLHEIQRFCSSLSCRHRHISDYFAQDYDKQNCGACDVCLGEHADLDDATIPAQKILSCVARTGERFGVGHIVDVLRGASTARVRELAHDRLSTFGLMKELGGDSIKQLTYQLLDAGLLDREGAEYPILKLNPASWEVMRGSRRVRLRAITRATKRAKVEQDAWEGVDRPLFEVLRELRRQIADEAGVPAFIILHDTSLRAMARFRPTTVERLQRISGFGKRKIERFGKRFIAAVRDHCSQTGLPSDCGEE